MTGFACSLEFSAKLATTLPNQSSERKRVEVIFVDSNHHMRGPAERLVARVYERVYGASPAGFPTLMAICVSPSGDVGAACGLRFQADGFFSALYLSVPVSAAVSSCVGAPVSAAQIIEVTSLASTSHRLGLTLVGDVVRSAINAGIHFGCFTATHRLATVLMRSGLDLIRIADAQRSAVPDVDRWGTYYDHDPGVYVVDCRPGTLSAKRENTP